MSIEPTPRLLIVPGLHDSPDDHWQTWLQARYRGSRRVIQSQWAVPDLERWAQRIGETLDHEAPGPWIAVAHSFGALALMRHLHLHDGGPIVAAILAAPADPRRFGVEGVLLQPSPLRDVLLVASRNDPWLSYDAARTWAAGWDVALLDAVEVGHLNSLAGFGPWPLGRALVERRLHQWYAGQRLERAEPHELSWAL
jgi:predicted alpha/beta hydrolase family esterase